MFILKEKEVTSSAIKEEHHATNAIDEKYETYFALQGGHEKGYWKCNLPKGKTVGRIKIKVVKNHEDELNGAKIFVGENEFDKFP